MLGFFFVVVVFLTLGINLSFKFLTFQAHFWLRMLKTEFNNFFYVNLLSMHILAAGHFNFSLPKDVKQREADGVEWVEVFLPKTQKWARNSVQREDQKQIWLV